MAKTIGVEVLMDNRLVACVIEVPERRIRRGSDVQRPFRWTINHEGGRLELVKTLAEAYTALAAAYPTAIRRIVWKGVNPRRACRKAV